jgi:hypothetical protein
MNEDYACFRKKACSKCHQEKNILLCFSEKSRMCRDCIREKGRKARLKRGCDPKRKWNGFTFANPTPNGDSGAWVA